MSYKQELQDLVIRLRNDNLNPDRLDLLEWRNKLDRWAEIIEFALSHPDEFKANLDTD